MTDTIVPLTDSPFDHLRITHQPHDLCMTMENEQDIPSGGFCIHPDDGLALAAALASPTAAAEREKARQAREEWRERSGVARAERWQRLGEAVDALLAGAEDRKDLVNWSLVRRDALNDVRAVREETERG